jgi:membrane-associated phospholipid phosphatase
VTQGWLTRARHDHPLWIAAATFVAIAVGSVGVGFILVTTHVTTPFERFFYEFALHHHNRILDTLVTPVNLDFLPFGVTPSYLNIWVVLLLGYVAIFHRKDIAPLLLTLIIAFSVSAAILYLNKHLVFRVRPFTVFPNNLSAQFKSYLVHVTSWPSGHTRDTAIFAALTAHYVPKLKWPVIIFALFVGFSRLYVGAHYPTDVIGGLLLGWAIGETAILAGEALWLRLRGSHTGQDPA